MTEKGIITMSQKELKHLHVVRKVLEKKLKQIEAADLLRLSTRHIRRITGRIRSEGDKGILHRSRGQPSHNAWDKEEKLKIKHLCEHRYEGFGPTLLSEKLFENEKVRISDETLRKWLLGWGLWRTRSKKTWHRHWRERKAHRGEMIQLDGSHHNWLEDRGPQLVLMGYVDDATNEFFGRFYDYEGTLPAFDSFKRYVRRYGLPRSVYLDKHSTYKSQAKPSLEDELKAEQPLSQFERGLKELGVEVIHANSPQAKGRVERVFRTLQDRLVKELKLKKATTRDEANRVLQEYLPEFNRRFRKAPLETADIHRPYIKNKRLDDILCIKTRHPLRNDCTLVHNRQLYQVLEKTLTKEIMVEERVNGQLLVRASGRNLRYKLIEQRPQKKIKPLPPKKARRPTRHVPPQGSYWRSGFKLKGSRKRGHFNFG